MPRRDELVTIAEQWISLWCAPVDWRLFDRLHAGDFAGASSAGRATTKRAFAAGLAELELAFPDLQARVEDLIADEAANRVAVRWSAVGTNVRPFLALGPTGRPMTGIEIIEIENGQIPRRWGEWDITAHPSPAAAADRGVQWKGG